MNNKRAHGEKRRSDDYNKVSHDLLELMMDGKATVRPEWRDPSLEMLQLVVFATFIVVAVAIFLH